MDDEAGSRVRPEFAGALGDLSAALLVGCEDFLSVFDGEVDGLGQRLDSVVR